MKAYKGFDKDLKCRGFQYEIGKEYTEDKADVCSCGFHACEYPLDVFSYYPPNDSRYCEVDLEANKQLHGDSKRVGKHIKISAEIGIAGIVKASVDCIMDEVLAGDKESNTGYRSAATNTGNQSVATNTGNQSAATNTGYRSAATNTGYRSAATNTGNWSVATNTGDYSATVVTGEESIAIATGYESKAKGALGCFIVLAEWKETGNKWHMIDVKSTKVDGEKIKPDVFYILKNGEFKEADEMKNQ